MLPSERAKGNYMRRTWNRLLAAAYARLPFLSRWVAGRLPGDSVAALPWAATAGARHVVPLPSATVALVTLGGVHLKTQPPFDMRNPAGDASFRVIPGTVVPADLTITHDYYDHTAADRDVNVVFPIDRLRELAIAGWIGRPAPRHIGAMGHILGAEQQRLVMESAPAIAQLLREDGVDYVVLVPG
jgi:D-proline reductase (dithiol) PrdB